jgi:CheY-like chemotaxis protein
MIEDQVQLEVVDHGKGAAAGARIPDGAAPLGVGIPGMRERLRQLGGKLEVDFGRNGTRVFAVLPVQGLTASHEDAGITSELEEPQYAGLASEADHHDTRRRILIVDDHEVMRRGVRGLIEGQEEWAICGEAVEGGEAIEKSRELRPDLVILDVNLPGMSGIDVARQIFRESQSTKVLFFTVHNSSQMMREVVNIGAHGYVAKSRGGQDLVDAVKTILDGKTFFPSFSMVAAGRRSA